MTGKWIEPGGNTAPQPLREDALPQPTLSTAEAGQLLGVSPRTVAALIRRGHLEGYPIHTSGGRIHAWRATASGVAAYQRRLASTNPITQARKGVPT